MDAIFEPVRFIRNAAARIAERHGLRTGWLNHAVKMFVVPHGKRILLDLSHLKVYIPDGDYLLAMKVLSARADTMDREDIKVLICSLGLNNAVQVMDIVKN